jgi:hypothetical protein
MHAHCSAALIATFLVLPAARAQSPVERVSLSSSGQQADRLSYAGPFSTDGRFTAFASEATNLVPNDTNGFRDAFLRDRLLGTTQRISVSSAGVEGNSAVNEAGISANGRWACFSSFASNLVAGDNNASGDVFVRDLSAGTTERASVDSSGAEAFGDSYWGSLSGDGRFVLFRSRAPLAGQTSFYRLLRRDRLLGRTELVDPVPAGCTRYGSTWYPSMSTDGRFIGFQARVEISGIPGIRDQVFVYDAQTGTVIQASSAPGGAPADSDSLWPVIAPDGSTIAFSSWASNLVAGYTPDSYGALFVHDLGNGANELVSVSAAGVPARGANYFPRSLSDGGRFVSFDSFNSTLVAGDTNAAVDSFVKDRLTGALRRVSVTTRGTQLANGGWGGHLTPDGRFLSLSSDDAHLVAGDTNGVADSFVLELLPASSQVYCSALVNSQGCTPAISASGTPSLASTLPFTIAGANLINQQPAWLVYSVAPSQRPFHGGSLCVERPLTLLAAQSSGGSSSGNDCSGGFAQDFNARIQSGLDLRLVPGTVVFAQLHSNDPLAPGGYSLTAGIAFTIQP